MKYLMNWLSVQSKSITEPTEKEGMYSFASYQLVSALFLRLLGVIYLIAFASLSVQIEGLIGSTGILPIAEELAFQASSGIANYFRPLTLFWINASDEALLGATVAGSIFSILIILNRFQLISLIAAFVLYLSLHQVSQPFLNFQWDGLLLETGLLAIFLATRTGIVIFLFRWLLFKLRFLSGISKLSSGDPAWSGLTALNSYFEVQPLPTPFAWYVHLFPEWLLRFGTGATLVIEILVPFMMFMPRKWRFAAAWITIFWQLLIILTSNHNWINFLTIALCLFLFDDRAIRNFIQWVKSVKKIRPANSITQADGLYRRLRISTAAMLAILILAFNAAQFWALVTRQPVSGDLGVVLKTIESYRTFNMYHVFPTMTTQRIELEISGSHDGREWRPYRFKYKPEEPGQRPVFILPHQPRLDWQMWFVSLQSKQLPWFEQFLYALLENAPAATSLLEHNPFKDVPPGFIRVDASRYTFTTPEQRQITGEWWQREPLGPFRPLPGVKR